MIHTSDVKVLFVKGISSTSTSRKSSRHAATSAETVSESVQPAAVVPAEVVQLAAVIPAELVQSVSEPVTELATVYFDSSVDLSTVNGVLHLDEHGGWAIEMFESNTESFSQQGMSPTNAVDQQCEENSSTNVIENETIASDSLSGIPECVEGRPVSTVENDNAPSDNLSEHDDGSVPKNKTRKRLRREEKWKRNQGKYARVHGLSYIKASGQLVEEKRPILNGCICHEKCRLKCTDKFSSDERQALLDGFYALDSDAQQVLLTSCVRASKPKVVLLEAKKHRKTSFHYVIRVGTEERQVCKTAVQSLYKVSKGKLDYIAMKIAAGTANTPLMQGKHGNRPKKTSDIQIQQVTDHIGLFPAESSHYSRNINPHRKYLSSVLTVKKMYEEYRIWCSSKNYNPVNASMYRNIFSTHFNLGFGSPKTDTCSKCDAETVDEKHKQLAEQAFKCMAEDRKRAKSETDVHYVTFDMQKTLPLPKLSTSSAFYLRQIWLYNLGVHYISGSLEKPYFHIWTETEALRGCEEVCSALLVFFDVANISGGSLVAWSDSCCGQNKNFYVMSLWQYLIKKARFTRIDHKFPVPGHSFIDSDRDFAHIESEVRKHQNIYTVDTYHNIMNTCMRVKQPCVTTMQGRFVTVKALPKTLHLVNRTVNTDNAPVHFRGSVHWVRVESFGKYM